ncbi:365L [Invertebrate iridescent virus Kaz2018]|nr:365L [Invertebrate iridescent virus Kaz2018]
MGFQTVKNKINYHLVVYLKKDILKNLIKILSIFLFLEHQKKHILRNLIVIEI